jgi:hypothetical protein
MALSNVNAKEKGIDSKGLVVRSLDDKEAEKRVNKEVRSLEEISENLSGILKC